ncbi:nucleotidyltransferase domain-containing protein [Trinickia violacea]|uniref:Nucleotidyltransferase domain-containing protein n=1 Tax=Trinickia violacea TaxID=2571746 RepID=A0A4P8ITW3_9BURK|nr:nucleotidyltransferase domain-containing protein [Trinickia violacea]QCP52688.1 nucleotidyltransferase domain-containing protein [Trinickia violacea]
MLDNDVLINLSAELHRTYDCHTAILYGSRARDDWDATSDIDVIAFRDAGGRQRVASLWNGLYLDMFIHATNDEAEPDWIRIHGGRVLFQRDAFGDQVLTEVSARFHAGPEQLSESEIAIRRAWAEKMLRRAGKGDTEGDYRRHWLLFSLLEDYFAVRGQWYLGPKQALRAMEGVSEKHCEVFKSALRPEASLEAIEEAVAATFELYAVF